MPPSISGHAFQDFIHYDAVIVEKVPAFLVIERLKDPALSMSPAWMTFSTPHLPYDNITER
jgi:hypothetical protein